MRYYSTNRKCPTHSLKEAVLAGLAPDGGLFMPGSIPQVPEKFLKNINKYSFPEIALEVSKKLFYKDIPVNILEGIVNNAFNFPLIVKKLDDNINVLELFHGPTLAFKDFGARFMAGLVSYYSRSIDKQLTILVATSGDTGSAVASGFYNAKGVRVVILYPSKKVSAIQEAQLTSLGENITALEVKGTFDDCQKLVKRAFLDPDLIRRMYLASSNSINLARLLPQSFYYFYAYSKLYKEKYPVVISVPSGNFGNLSGGLIAKKMGLPVSLFIASTNINDTVPVYFTSGKYIPKPSKATISNAMDVGDPSNFARMLYLYDNKKKNMARDVVSFRFTDSQTKSAIKDCYKNYNYIPDPHGAVGLLGLKKYMKETSKPVNGMFLDTAHPAKFKETIEATLNIKIDLPENLKKAMNKEKKSILISNEYENLKDFLLNEF